MASTVDVRPDAGERAGRTRWRGRRGLAWVFGGLGVAAVTGWAGLQVEPAPLPEADIGPQVEADEIPTVALPQGLPAPVARFYSALYGDRVPVVDSAVISGRGEMRISGITFPARFRFSHVTGQDYRHYIELTAFGRRVTAVNEWFVDGRARLELPVGVSEGPAVDQGANLALWAEAVWMPSVWITDPSVRWEPVDDTSARLVVPFGAEEEVLTVRFDPATDMLASMQSLRFKGEKDTAKTLWLNEASEWGVVHGHPVPLRTEITWGDEDSPWAVLRTENVRYNADLGTYIGAAGA